MQLLVFFKVQQNNSVSCVVKDKIERGKSIYKYMYIYISIRNLTKNVLYNVLKGNKKKKKKRKDKSIADG